MVTIGFIGFYLGDVGSSMDPWIQYLHTNTRLWLCLQMEPRVGDLSNDVQVGGKTADKGAVFTVSNGQLPGERGSGG